MTIQGYLSPNFDSREGAPIDMLVLHYTGMPTGHEALLRLCDPGAKVSAHYLVEEDGRIFLLVPEAERAWHAGVASWRGYRNINARSIGIEIVNPGHEWGYRSFPEAQMQAVAVLCSEILGRHAIPARNVVAHSDVAPARKSDPGELFDWAWLAEKGIGVFPPALSALVDADQPERACLEAYGYDFDIASENQIITAFQRHFRPQHVSGVWDGECAARLHWLLEHC